MYIYMLYIILSYIILYYVIFLYIILYYITLCIGAALLTTFVRSLLGVIFVTAPMSMGGHLGSAAKDFQIPTTKTGTL